MNLWETLALSSVSASFISSIFMLVNNWLIRRIDYKNSYYSLLLKKRLASYAQIEDLLLHLNHAILTDDKQVCHLIFSDEKTFIEYAQKLTLSKSQNRLWLSEILNNKIAELLNLFYQYNKAKNTLSVTQFGCKVYDECGILRDEILELLAQDMIMLPDIRAFLKQRKKYLTHLKISEKKRLSKNS